MPAIQYPSGYRVSVTGAQVLSAPGATTLRLANTSAPTVKVAISAP